MSNTLIPTEIPKPELPTEITDAEANEAARSLGLNFFSADKSKLLRKIGLFQTQQGVIHLGVGRLAASDEALQKLIDVAVTMAEDKEDFVENRINAINAARGLVDSLHNSIQMSASFLKGNLISGPQGKKRAFIDEGPIVPIQANAGANVTVNIDNVPNVEQNK